MKAIVLAGGSGSRLYPLTSQVCKQLLPVYDKPMIYYPLSVLMEANLREVLIISTPSDLPKFQSLFGNGSNWGLKLEYVVQPQPDGLAQAFILAESFIKDDPVCLILGDNIFYGDGMTNFARNSILKTKDKNQATVFGYRVSDPERYGVVTFDQNKKVVSIDEKPKNPKSNYAVTGLYFYPNDVVQLAKSLSPSSRGELEITDLNQLYLDQNRLNVELLGQGFAWLDTGTPEALLDASNFVATIEKRQSLKLACLEEIAYKKGYINQDKLIEHAKKSGKNQYNQYLMKIAKMPNL